MVGRKKGPKESLRVTLTFRGTAVLDLEHRAEFLGMEVPQAVRYYYTKGMELSALLEAQRDSADCMVKLLDLTEKSIAAESPRAPSGRTRKAGGNRGGSVTPPQADKSGRKASDVQLEMIKGKRGHD